ncbi:aspartate kinase [bacterium SCSIO 12696]|nr:aspartate kinase [bacterium SCSIO 12696]
MSLIVQKYGGTSVGSVERIEAVADKVADFHRRGNGMVVVLSAMSGETNRLIGLAREIHHEPTPREMDVLVSTGEQVTIALLSMALHKRGCDARSYTGSQVRILTDGAHTKARIEDIDVHRMKDDLDRGRVVVVAGFQGTDAEGNITTLGRGGSDTTAVALAAALKADECQIYTDVDGVYTTDPRVVPNARRLETVTFEEMLELASEGAKVLQIRSVEFAGKYKVPLRVLSSFGEGGGTLITFEEKEEMEKPVVTGIAFNREEAKVTVRGIPDHPGVAYNVLAPVGEAGVDVDVICQNVAEDDAPASLTFTVSRGELPKAKAVAERVAKELQAKAVETDDQIAKISVVGVGMKSHSGVASTMFKALSDHNINIQLITTSEIKITVVVEEKYLELAVRALHDAFELETPSNAA